MKIYLLRHEDRTQDATFFSPLTKQGLENSVKLIKDLEKSNINIVYSSPFIRTLQTIYPYVKKNKFKINLEYGLSEVQHQNIIPKNSYAVRLPNYVAESFNYNEKYRSLHNPEDHKYPEKEKDIQSRVRKTLQKIIEKHYQTNDNVILVTHQGVSNSILKIINKKSFHKGTDKVVLPQKNKYGYNYPKGALSLIFSKCKWYFKPINWKIN